MKICFLTPEYPHPQTRSSGGIGTSIRNLANKLSEQGQHRIRVLVIGQDTDEVFEDGLIEVHKMKNVTFVKGLSWLLTRIKIQRTINKWVRSREINVVESADWGGLTAFIRLRCPVVIRLHGTDTFFCHLENRQVKWFNRYLEQKELENANAILAVSRFVGEHTQRLFNLQQNYQVVHNGLDVSAFQPEYQEEKEHFVILYFGTLIRKKGALELPGIFNEVCRHLPDAKLRLVGKDAGDILSGSKSTWALMQQHFTPQALQHVEYVGPVPYTDIRHHITEASVCIFPSYAECWPMSWMEAMAMEKAIVASDIGWAREMIEDGEEGFLVDPSHHVQYAQAIIKLADRQLNEQFGKAARAKVERCFSSEIIATETLRHYQKILERL